MQNIRTSFGHLSLSFLFSILAFFSLLAVVNTSYQVRKESIQAEELLKERGDLYTRQKSLLLEHSALRTEGRVEKIARNKLDMKNTTRDEIITLIIERN